LLYFWKFRSPQEFLRGAELIQHPFDKTCALPDSMLYALALTLREGNVGVMKRRLAIQQTWGTWDKELRSQEFDLHQSVPMSLRQVLKGKNLLLWKRLQPHSIGRTRACTRRSRTRSSSLETRIPQEFLKT
jgi:hypothetical protein